jgi:DNA polymerase-1
VTSSNTTLSAATDWYLASRGVDLRINPDRAPAGQIAVDIETDEADNFVGIALTNGQWVGYYTSLSPLVKHTLLNSKLVGHNVKGDARWLRQWGVSIKPEQLIFDTRLASYVKDSAKESHSLKSLAQEVLGLYWWSYYEMTNFKKGLKTVEEHAASLESYTFDSVRSMKRTENPDVTLDKMPVQLVANYCGMDAWATFHLWQWFEKNLSEAEKKYLHEIEMPTLRVLLEMELAGVEVHVPRLRSIHDRLSAELASLIRRVKQVAPAIENINSNQQIAAYLISKGFQLPKTEKGNYQVNAKVRQQYEDRPIIKMLSRYSELEKLTSTYTGPLLEAAKDQERYRVHSNFNQSTTVTGRLSSSNPNLQNIPTRTETGDLLRSVFVPKVGHKLIVADYGQIEPRLMAHFSKDPVMWETFEKGLDFYDVCAEQVGRPRKMVKTYVMAKFYGAGIYKIAEVLKCSVQEASQFDSDFRKAYRAFFQWKETQESLAKARGYVETLMGRRIHRTNCVVPDMIQGSAAEVMKKAMCDLVANNYHPVLTVHDELHFELSGKDEVSLGYDVVRIKAVMESVVPLAVPLKVEIHAGDSWQEGKN